MAAIVTRNEKDSRFWEYVIAGLIIYGLGLFCLITVRTRKRGSKDEDEETGVGEFIGERIGEEFSSLVPGDFGSFWDEPERVKQEYPRTGEIARDMSIGKVPAIIDMLGSRSKLQRDNAHLTLCLYTGCDHGEDIAAWRRWYEVNKDRQPHEWWAGNLRERGYETDNLALEEQIPVLMVCMMEEENQYVRYTAERLLSHLTGTKVLYSHDGSEKLRRWQLKKWKADYDGRKKLRKKRPRKGR
jgi:hypothetical protein